MTQLIMRPARLTLIEFINVTRAFTYFVTYYWGTAASNVTGREVEVRSSITSRVRAEIMGAGQKFMKASEIMAALNSERDKSVVRRYNSDVLFRFMPP